MTLSEIETADRAGLGALWRELHGRDVPKGMSQSLIRRFLATDFQSRRFGGLPREVRARLVKPVCSGPPKAASRLKPGGTLLREWNGTTHRVDVEDGGYLWEGRRYRSLSAIAKEITGAHWSGPRFFGLGNGAAK